jgi:hypothetical protein
MTDFRALCAELLQELEHASAWDYQQGLKDQARAVLAQPEPEGPTIDDILELCADHEFHLGIDGANEEESAMGLLGIVNSALTRWGRPTPQPADGEVAELVEWLRRSTGCADESFIDLRAADLLERLSPPQPIPVSERLPGPEDCDAEGRCWLCGKVEGDWRLLNPEKSGVPQLKYCFSHWLPAHALPVPAND